MLPVPHSVTLKLDVNYISNDLTCVSAICVERRPNPAGTKAVAEPMSVAARIASIFILFSFFAYDKLG